MKGQFESMNQDFAAIVIGCTGQVGSAVVEELRAIRFRVSNCK
jgi:nucleoside-diphosphate-sugar epimerase